MPGNCTFMNSVFSHTSQGYLLWMSLGLRLEANILIRALLVGVEVKLTELGTDSFFLVPTVDSLIVGFISLIIDSPIAEILPIQ